MDKNARSAQLYSLLGELPDRDRAISATVVSQERRGAYVLEELSLDLNGFEAVPAYLVRPVEQRRPLPGVLYNHAHGGRYTIGKEELISGRGVVQTPPYAEVLVRMGYVVMCIDAWTFGPRAGPSESDVFKESLWHGRVLWGMMVYDGLRALDYLAARPEVDAAHLGTLGLSMGSTAAWWLAALDTRVTACVDICCLTDYQALIETGGLDRHGLYYYVPGLLKHFTTADINALIAPRAHLSLAGNLDPLTPPEGLDRLDAALKAVYESENAADAWKMVREDVGHVETPLMRAEIVSFLHRWLPSPMSPPTAELDDLRRARGLPESQPDTRLPSALARVLPGPVRSFARAGRRLLRAGPSRSK